MKRESNIELDKWDMADNMDLYYILQDFEEYFEMKFMKKPVITKKVPGSDDYSRRGMPLPPSGEKKSTRNTTATTEASSRKNGMPR